MNQLELLLFSTIITLILKNDELKDENLALRAFLRGLNDGEKITLTKKL